MMKKLLERYMKQNSKKTKERKSNHEKGDSFNSWIDKKNIII